MQIINEEEDCISAKCFVGNITYRKCSVINETK